MTQTKKNQYGCFNGEKLTIFTKATDLKGAVCIHVKSAMRLPENQPVFVDGVFDHKKTLQNYVNDYGESTLENMTNDGEENMPTVVCCEDVADNICNSFGWVTENRTSIPNQTLYNEIVALMKRWEIKDYEA